MNKGMKNIKNVKKIIKLTDKMKVSNQNGVVYKAVEDKPEVTFPLPDKLSVVIDMPDPVLHGVMIAEILDLVKDEPSGFKFEAGQGRYPLAVSILCPGKDGVFVPDGQSVLFQSTKKEFLTPQLRLSFNPYLLLGEPTDVAASEAHPAAEYLDFVFQGLWGAGFFELLAHARITGIEVWRHVLNRSPEDYLAKVKYSKTCQSIFGAGGKLETIYFGKRASNQTVIYNKAKQLNKHSQNDILRIEQRLKPKGIKIADLWAMPNPFTKTFLYSLKNDNPPLGEAHWIAFRDSCRFRGIGKAIQMQPVKYQKKLNAAISENPVSWWAMDDATWTKAWHEALKLVLLDRVPETAQPLNQKKINGS